MPRDYSQTGTSWSMATTGNNNYKPVPTTTASSVTNYPPHQATSAYQWTGQQPYLISTYPYGAPVRFDPLFLDSIEYSSRFF